MRDAVNVGRIELLDEHPDDRGVNVAEENDIPLPVPFEPASDFSTTLYLRDDEIVIAATVVAVHGSVTFHGGKGVDCDHRVDVAIGAANDPDESVRIGVD